LRFLLRFTVNWILRFGIIEVFLVFFLLVNVLTFFLYVVDKRQAEKNKWRVNKAVLIFFTLACGGFGAFIGMRFAKHIARSRRFRIATMIGLAIALIPAIHVVSGFTLGRTIRFVEIEFHSENWPAALNGYRIAFMTDMHIIADESIRRVVSELNDRSIDLLLLGGDFSTRNAHYQGTIREIAQVITTDGIFGVEGNHDNYRWLFDVKERYGIVPLDNCGTHLRQGFFLAGVQDLWNRSPDISVATQGAHTNDFVLLLSHNPDVTMQQSTIGIDLVLAGHTHGGQIAFLGYAMYLLRGSITDYGTRFSYGFNYSADGVPVFTSRGIGVYYTLPRIFARPEVVIFTMYRE